MLPSIDHRLVGWTFVVIQVILIAWLALMPQEDQWLTGGWVGAVAWTLIILGFAGLVASARALGPGLTPNPVPNRAATLRTDGPYRWVRHPIYASVLLIIAGVTLRSGNTDTVVLAAVLIVFFYVKTGWEERRLRERFPLYADYQASTSKFLPLRALRRRSRS